MQPTLLILAAGVGSRYGGLKQVDGIGPGGEAILEYSVYDAMRAGFGKVVFVIRQDIEKDFRDKVGKKIEPHIQTEYAFQEFHTALEWLPVLPERKKPWGTGHAMLAAKPFLTEPFVAINADDFYGADAFAEIGDFLRHQCNPQTYGMVAYRVGNTLSENGAVSRGVCHVDARQHLTEVIERTKIERFAEGIAFIDERGERHYLADNTPVSMNFWGLHHSVIEEAEAQFRAFVAATQGNPSAEFYIPLIINNLIQAGKINLQVRYSESPWYGVTYTADKETVQAALAGLVQRGVYPKGLFV